MNKDYKTSIHIDLGFEVDPSKPFSIYSEKVSNMRCALSHRHPRSQVIYCDTGIMKVIAGSEIWIVNPLQGIWIPGDVEHQVFFPASANMHTIFIDPSRSEALPSGSFAFDMNMFFKSLILKITSANMTGGLSPQMERVMAVLLDELSIISPSRNCIPLSDEPRLQQILDDIQNDLTYRLPSEYFANNRGMSTRTLTRLFSNHLGITFMEWRTRIKLIEAIRRLESKQSVKAIAFDLGYENASSFIYAFKKYFGKTPGNYLN